MKHAFALGAALLATATLTLSACQQKKETYDYNFTENNCPTNDHQFSSKDEYCKALRNEALNNFCALDQRRQRYQADCGGDF
jgi:hypothetical protein